MSASGNEKASAGYYTLISQWLLGKIQNQTDTIKITKIFRKFDCEEKEKEIASDQKSLRLSFPV